MIDHTPSTARLLPWPTPEGKPCYLIGGDTGHLSRVADNVETVQLDMAVELREHAADILNDPHVTSDQFRFLAARMTEALRDVHRIAESRGARLSRLAYDGTEDEPGDQGEAHRPAP